MTLTGKEDRGESGLVHRAVRLELDAQRVRFRSDHGRRLLAAVHAVLTEFVRSDFAVHFHSVVLTFGLEKRQTREVFESTGNSERKTYNNVYVQNVYVINT